MTWPLVQDEFRTLAMLQQGYSIARFGDGEFKMMDGAGYVREPPNKRLAAELRSVLRRPHPKCLRGIPTFDPISPKFPTWSKHLGRFTRLMKRTRGDFYSAFISRPDSAPWIRTKEFAQGFMNLWGGKRVAVLCEKNNGSLRALDYAALEMLDWVECPSHEAYARIDEFEKKLIRNDPHIVWLSCGMTATCLANRLTKHGIQAIDFGSGGSFIAKLLAPKPDTSHEEFSLLRAHLDDR
jgi:hypothetical protein